MDKGSKAKLALFIKSESSNGFTNFNASITAVDVQQDKVVGLEYGDDLRELILYSQGEDNNKSHGLYGFDIEYRDIFSIDRLRAKKMCRTLEGIHRKMEKLYARFGPCNDLPAYMARISDVLGIKYWVFTQKPKNGVGLETKILPIKDGIWMLKDRVNRWQHPEQYEEKKAEVSV